MPEPSSADLGTPPQRTATLDRCCLQRPSGTVRRQDCHAGALRQSFFALRTHADPLIRRVCHALPRVAGRISLVRPEGKVTSWAPLRRYRCGGTGLVGEFRPSVQKPGRLPWVSSPSVGSAAFPTGTLKSNRTHCWQPVRRPVGTTNDGAQFPEPASP